MQDESHDARAQRLKEIFQGLFLLAQRKGASTASVGINDTAFAVSDNGPGWTARTFRRQFPVWDLSRRLHEIGCTEMQIESRSRRGGWTAGLSLAGIIFPQEEAALWPSSSPHCRAPVFFDVSSGNELLDLRAGTADVGWDQLYMPREETVDAHRYLHSAVEFMQAVDGDDPVSALVAGAGHLCRDLRRALARRRSKEDADARPESP